MPALSRKGMTSDRTLSLVSINSANESSNGVGVSVSVARSKNVAADATDTDDLRDVILQSRRLLL